MSADFDLQHLPSSLRRLRLRYDGQARQLGVPELPDHLRCGNKQQQQRQQLQGEVCVLAASGLGGCSWRGWLFFNAHN